MGKRNREAFTFVELCIVVGVLVILAAALFPMTYRPNRHEGVRVKCVYNLRQVGLAFKTWSLDNNDCYPMQVSTNKGGTLELLSVGAALAVMSNYLSTPKVVFCPAEQKGSYATNFSSDFDNRKISYFVGIDSLATNDSMIVSGDRNITNGLALHNGLLELTPNRPTGWTHELHGDRGNILLVDGSVQQVTTPRLRQLIRDSVTGTNRLAMP